MKYSSSLSLQDEMKKAATSMPLTRHPANIFESLDSIEDGGSMSPSPPSSADQPDEDETSTDSPEPELPRIEAQNSAKIPTLEISQTDDVLSEIQWRKRGTDGSRSAVPAGIGSHKIV